MAKGVLETAGSVCLGQQAMCLSSSVTRFFKLFFGQYFKQRVSARILQQ